MLMIFEQSFSPVNSSRLVSLKSSRQTDEQLAWRRANEDRQKRNSYQAYHR